MYLHPDYSNEGWPESAARKSAQLSCGIGGGMTFALIGLAIGAFTGVTEVLLLTMTFTGALMGLGIGLGYGAEEDFDEAQTSKVVDPLIFDLNGDGAKVDELKMFDYDNDGFNELGAWSNKEDAFLVIDKNVNGKIDNGSELFGDAYLLKNGKLAKDGFEALKEFDSNNDGIIDSDDENFSKLQLLKGDGTLVSLTQVGISSISLTQKNQNIVDELGNKENASGSFVKNDGTLGAFGEFLLKTNTNITEYNGNIQIPEEIASLADAYAGGKTLTLKQKMALDVDG